MRVLFWSERFWPTIGGTQIFATRLLPALQERGYEFVVVTLQDSPDLPAEDHYKGIPVYRFPFLDAVVARNVEQVMALRRRVIALKQTFAPALIHLHGVGLTNVFFQLETKNASTASLLVTLAVELEKEEASRAFVARILRQADWVTGKADPVLAQAQELEPRIIPHSSVIHNGLAVPALLPAPLPVEAPRLLCLGRLNLQKGFDLALAAFALVVRRFPQARLIVAGDGDERASLEHQAAELGLSESVEFIGWVVPNEVLALMNTATVVIMPSRWEGFPSVALQAAMMARPVVATRVVGLSDIVVHQQTGLLVELEDSAGLAEAIAFVLEQPDKAQDMGQAARCRVRDVFSWQRCVDAYDALYRKLIQTNSL